MSTLRWTTDCQKWNKIKHLKSLKIIVDNLLILPPCLWVICGRWFYWRIFVRHFVVKVFIVSKIICFHSYTYGYKTGDWEIFCELCEHQHTLFHAVTILSKCCPFIGYALFDRSKSKSSTYRMIFWNVLLLKLFNFSYNKEKMLIHMGQNL